MKEIRKYDILLEISSPQGLLTRQMVSLAEFPGAAGRFEVLRGHAPLISSLVKGRIRWNEGEREGSLEILSGFVEVLGNKISACVETA